MGMFIFVIGFLTMVVSGIFFILGLIKKKPLRNKIVIFMGGFLLLIGGALLTPAATPELHVDEAELVTNEQGEAAITGRTNPEAQLTINGVEVSLADETFSYAVQLEDEEEQEFTVQTSMGGITKEEVVTVKPSHAFLASLQAEKQEQEALVKAETALALAETQPNQKNYHLAIGKALDTAEASLERSDFDQAKELVAQAVLNKETFESRLSTVETKISEKEAEALVTEAVQAVEAAEAEPTKDRLAQAEDAVARLKTPDEELAARTKTVAQTIIANEQAAAQAKAEEERQAAATVPEQSQPAAASNQAQTSVLVTPTGSKYHTRKCGNGTYTPATLAEAQSRGLTPCAKCFP